jgi:hypothetical protein
MILEIPDFYLGLIAGIIITLIVITIIGFMLNREKGTEDVYHPLNKKE